MKPGRRLSRRTVLAVSAGLVASAVANTRLARAKTRITIVTGGTGGVFYPYGGGIAKILSEKVPDMQATAQVTGGSVDNVKLLAQGEAELGFATLDSAWEGLNGLSAYAKDGKQDIRTVALLYDSFFHVCAAADAQIGKVADFKGKRVSVGSAGSSTELIADRVLKAAGLDPKADVGRDNLGVGEFGRGPQGRQDRRVLLDRRGADGGGQGSRGIGPAQDHLHPDECRTAGDRQGIPRLVPAVHAQGPFLCRPGPGDRRTGGRQCAAGRGKCAR